jgi:energy-coupling factor transporter ATP-binding protein EcfA2
MAVKFTIKNYRCFSSPATIELSKGFTAFVGVNNAGKSAFMRFLLEMRPLFAVVQDHRTLHGHYRPSRLGLTLFMSQTQTIFSNLNTNGLEFSIEFGDQSSSVANKPAKVVFKAERNFGWYTEIYLADGRMISKNPGITLEHEFLVVESGRVIADLSHLIQITRDLSNTLYVGPFRNAINIGSRENYFDIQIGDSFIKKFRQLKTGRLKSDSKGIQEITENICRIFGFRTLEIDSSADDTSLHIVVNGKHYNQHELGSGLVQFIVVLANAAIKRPKLILIDEPELNLHPRLQLEFLASLESYTDYGVWFSTHSVGLARAAAEQVYSVIRRGDGDSIIRPLEGTPRLAEFLGEMSFSTHRELGFDKLLFVEGSTDVKVMQQFLRKMSTDHKIVTLPLSHIPPPEELDEVLRITSKLAVLIDSERSSEGAPLEQKRATLLEHCKVNGIKARALKLRATENYFPDACVKQVFGENYRGLGPYDLLKNADPNWSKSQNWKLAAAMPIDDVLSTDLGQFLESL